MPTISSEVTIPHTPSGVWPTLRDVRAVASCLPGVEVTDELGDDRFAGRLRTKLGAISANFAGEARVEIDDATRTGVIDAKGADANGGSRATAAVRYEIRAADAGESTLAITADIKLQGRLAQFGKSGLLQEISNQMIGTFADNLAEMVSSGRIQNEAAGVRVGGVLARAVWARFRARLAWTFRRRPKQA